MLPQAFIVFKWERHRNHLVKLFYRTRWQRIVLNTPFAACLDAQELPPLSAADGAGGVSVAGGGDGGAGAGSSQRGNVGIGPGTSPAGLTNGYTPSGAGGAGHAFAGTAGFESDNNQTRSPGGAAYGDAQLTDGLQGGSGASGGGNDDDNEEGAGGGGSGGTVYLVAATLHIEGALTATGGLGGRDDYYYNRGANRECCNNGGPGSVGRLDCTSATPSAAPSHQPPRLHLHSVAASQPA